MAENLLKCGLLMLGVLTGCTSSELASANGIRPSNVLGGLEQHASFSFVRPGLTQTAFAFNGPASHQSFSSSVGDPHLAHRVLPSVAHALAYRNPGLGYARITGGPILSSAFVASPPVAAYHRQQNDFQRRFHPQTQQALALAYQQQLQQYQQVQAFPDFVGVEYPQHAHVQALHNIGDQQSVHQAHIARLFNARFASPQQIQLGNATPEQTQL
ncbi:uncharacterized protein LOC131672094 isoform X2 [Phymastichus coffea]|uniref:uncharacterized protein LOC131672094 isoform X2 n=1 Tax=Phymastichus coffea TaxID=108790 RepID=UPI00273B0A7A|nr:uncharacterized protein LOC131672094 isoform X2 [Phymastichus coffea]